MAYVCVPQNVYCTCILACLAILRITATDGSSYIPGEQGAPWTMEELLIVKAKLYAIFDRWGEVSRQLGITVSWTDGPQAPKFLRLGFHDCLKLVYAKIVLTDFKV